MNIKDVYMVDYIRTPFSRSRPGNRNGSAFSELRGEQLVAFTLRNMFEERLKGKVEKNEISEFLLGCSLPIGSNWAYAGRNALFAGNMPYTVPSVVFDRQCGSAMAAMHHGMMEIMLGYADTILVSGMEHMYKEPMQFELQKHWIPPVYLVMESFNGTPNPWYRHDVDITTSLQMVQTAQKLLEEEVKSDRPFTREEMDRWGVRSHELAAKALKEGYFKDELLPVMAHKEGDSREKMLVDRDLSIREGTTYEKVASLSAVSDPGFKGGYKNPVLDRREYREFFNSTRGQITAGNSSPLNAGAATCLLMNEESMESHGMKPMVKLISMGWAGVDPSVMGRGPVPATEMALEKAGMKADDIDFWEINEAFAIVTLNCMKHFNIPPEKVNVKGGAIAIGHPLGASGVRLPGTLARILVEKKAKYGLANLCCGSGQGVAVIMENMNI
ncbi:MAG: acetyl-CoA C-acyltransferase [Candidatus Lokiarchaeota archaeon]|nr:acetyl-CoA C-acyltransferase [Candidatus Lokiarchaeota archaeon]